MLLSLVRTWLQRYPMQTCPQTLPERTFRERTFPMTSLTMIRRPTTAIRQRQRERTHLEYNDVS
jgi:hypothetical protein